MAHWRTGCAAGSYLSCKAALVLEDVIEKRVLIDTTLARRSLSADWCLRDKTARSLVACFDLVADHGETQPNRAAAYEVLNAACAREELAACGLIVRTHKSLLKQKDLEVFAEDERRAARALAEGEYGLRYGAAVARLARTCERGDWVACGFCGDRRRGYVTFEPVTRGQKEREALPAKTRQRCDERWRSGALVFQRALFAK